MDILLNASFLLALAILAPRRRSLHWFTNYLASLVPAAAWSQSERGDALRILQFVKGYALGFAQAVLDWCDQREADVKRAAQ
jgi:hypothetical protein